MLRLHTQSAFQESLSSTVLFMASKIVRHRKMLSIPPTYVSCRGSQSELLNTAPRRVWLCLTG